MYVSSTGKCQRTKLRERLIPGEPGDEPQSPIVAEDFQKVTMTSEVESILVGTGRKDWGLKCFCIDTPPPTPSSTHICCEFVTNNNNNNNNHLTAFVPGQPG